MQNVASWGESLKNRREALGMTPNRLAPHLGVSGESIRRWERDLLPSADTMRRIEQIMERLEAQQPTTLGLQVAQIREELETVRASLQALSLAVRELSERLEPPPGRAAHR